ncbi:MAG: hypothetical protein WAT70_01180 [Rhizobiaceae bacterium]
MRRIAILSLPVLLALAGAAGAQTDICIKRGTNGMDRDATAAWREMDDRKDPEFMQAMAGVWYSETTSPQTGQVSQLYLSYRQDGIFDYQNRVCSATGCNDYAGHGLFAGFFLGNGRYTSMSILSDLNRDRECTGSTGRFVDERTIEDSGGGRMTRVR